MGKFAFISHHHSSEENMWERRRGHKLLLNCLKLSVVKYWVLFSTNLSWTGSFINYDKNKSV